MLSITLPAEDIADSVKQNTPFGMGWTHDGLMTDGYTVLVDNVPHATIPVTALVSGVMFLPTLFPQGLPKGTYHITVYAFGPGGQSGNAPIIDLSVTAGNPSNPSKPHIIKGGGGS